MESLHPCTRTWFAEALESPTRIQREAWPVLAGGENALLLAPTGSGKTLAAVLAAIDRLMFQDPPPLKGGDRGGIATPKRAAKSRRSGAVPNPSPGPSLQGRGGPSPSL